MRRTILATLMMLCLLLTACGTANGSLGGNDMSKIKNTLNSTSSKPNTDRQKKILIAYYSLTGNTQKAAEKIQTQTGGDLFSIKASNPYPLEHDACLDRDVKEIRENARPAIANKVENIGQYDTIFIGYPIWYYQAPMIVNTFLESYDLKGKTIIPFCTSGGYPVEKSVDVLKKSCANATIMEGFRYSTESDLIQRLKKMELVK